MLDIWTYDLACKTFKYDPTINIFGDNVTALIDRFLRARQSEVTCGINAFSFRWGQ